MKKPRLPQNPSRALYIKISGKGYIVAQVGRKLRAIPETAGVLTPSELHVLTRYLREEGYFHDYFSSLQAE